MKFRIQEIEYNVEAIVDEGNGEFDQSLQLFSFKVFEFIEYFMQNPDMKSVEAQNIKEELQEIDKKLTEIFQTVFPQKIEKAKKTEMMQRVKTAKEGILQIFGFIRDLECGKSSNDSIARLNQLAYQGV